MISELPAFSPELISDILTIIGLILDGAGAIFLIGPNLTLIDFPIMGWMGAKIWPNLRDARNGLIHLKRTLELTPDHEGFRPLATIYQEKQGELFEKAAHPKREAKKFEMYSSEDGMRVRFTYAGGTLSNEKQENLEEILDRRIENTFRTTGAWLLLTGFSIQILARILTLG